MKLSFGSLLQMLVLKKIRYFRLGEIAILIRRQLKLTMERVKETTFAYVALLTNLKKLKKFKEEENSESNVQKIRSRFIKYLR